MIIMTEEKHIDELSNLRILQQKDDWGNEYEGPDEALSEKTKQYLETHLNKDLFMFAYVEGGSITATCGFHIIKYLPQCNDDGVKAYFCNVFTKQEYRCKGIQTNLFAAAINFAKEKGIKKMQLSTDNPTAIRIYKKFGFKFNPLAMNAKF